MTDPEKSYRLTMILGTEARADCRKLSKVATSSSRSDLLYTGFVFSADWTVGPELTAFRGKPIQGGPDLDAFLFVDPRVRATEVEG